MKRSSRPRSTAALSKALNRQLNAYALAAGAAGVGLLLSQPAEAKIVYTPAHARIILGVPHRVDLNHDGIVDFYLLPEESYFGEEIGLYVCQFLGSNTNRGPFCSSSAGTNAVRTIESNGRQFGAALRYGQKIQRGEQFAKRKDPLGGLTYNSSSNKNWFGPWMNGGMGVEHRFLGLKFKIKGRFHFGWARLTVKTTSNNFTATLTGYAYETIPGKGIVAGQTKGPEVTTLNAPSLGHLAAGASAIPAWRSGK